MVESATTRVDPARVTRDVLAIVESLTAELGLRPAARPVDLDDSLDRDLGLGSLERVELLLRLEESLGVELPDQLLAEAESPRDLVGAVLAGEPALREGVPELTAAVVPGTPAPGSAKTLLDVLGWHAEVDPERVHIVLRTESGREQPITYSELWDRSLALASGLRERGARPGDAVALMLRTEAAFFPAFFGTLLAGAVPVPIYPPFRLDRLEEYARRQVRILENAEARLLLTFSEAERIASLLRARVRSLREVIPVERLAASPGAPAPRRAAAGDPALIQYTSGSTGEPKGVLLSHANLLANIRAIGQALAIRPDDVGVSWLPLYHDMGLIGSWLGALYYGIPMVILSPLAFLSRPARWLWTIHAHRATLSPAPNFAFDLCARKIGDEEIRGLDLSSWRLALNGSEPVSPDTIERFVERFAPYGFRREAMCPVYGLAESSVGLAMSPPGRGARVDRVARESFARSRRAAPAAADEPAALRFVSCGRPLPGHAIRIVGSAAEPLGERVEGRVEFRGPSVTSGYFRNPEATRAVLHEGWMDSGDLGYWADGDLFITGRQKDIIIKAGRNFYPQEVEEVVGEIPRIRKGCVAAFGVPDPTVGTERLVVVAESRETAPESRERLRALVIDRVVAALGIPPDTVVIGPPGSVLKTSSGKVRRGATREAFLGGVVSRPQPAVWTQRLHLLVSGHAARLRRIADGARSLAFAGWVGALLVVTLPPLWGLVRLLQEGRSVDRAVRAWCRVVLTLAGCRPRVEGLERIPARGAVVFAANHSSYVDSVALLAAIPADFRFVAKRELASRPLVGTVIRKVAHPTIERVDLLRSVADAERVTALLRSGISLLVFPEGTFVRAPGILPFRLGAFKAAVDAGCPVVPVAIRGTRLILPADAWAPKPGRITIAIGEPVEPGTGEWREMVRLRDRVRDEIARRAGERLVTR